MENQKNFIAIATALMFLTIVSILGVFLLLPSDETSVTLVADTQDTGNSANDSQIIWNDSPKDSLPIVENPAYPQYQEIKPEYIDKAADFPIEIPAETPVVKLEPAKPISTPKPSTATKPVTAPKPRVVPSNNPSNSGNSQFWIQVGSFKDKFTADNLVNSINDEFGIRPNIFNVNVDGVNFHRVRVGPYGTKSEADNFILTLKTLPALKNTEIFATRVAPN